MVKKEAAAPVPPRAPVPQKLENFIQKLDSSEPQDVKNNAKVLAEIIKSFSRSFGVPLDIVIRLISDHGENVNLKDIRNVLFEKYT